MLNEQLAILSDVERRRILFTLAERNPRTISPIGSEGGTDRGDHDAATAIYHVHLPKLEAAGFIDWDREASVIRKGPQFEEIRPLVDLLDTHQEDLPGAVV